jgi:hypothetical protein
MGCFEGRLAKRPKTKGTSPFASLFRASRALATMSLPLICVEGVAAGFAGPDERFGAGEGRNHRGPDMRKTQLE